MAKRKGKMKSTKPIADNPESLQSEAIAGALTSMNPVLLKMCRLCEAKDGPFLNIFDAEKTTAKKIDELLPFVIAENDDLPHKICFRCSAKVEELYEFVQKCIKTQENLRKFVGKEGSLAMKSKLRRIWEEKLNKNNISNDDVCDAVIKKAMAGIEDIPLKPLPLEEDMTVQTVKSEGKKKLIEIKKDNNTDSDLSLKTLKISLDKCDQKRSTRSSRCNNNTEDSSDNLNSPARVTRLSNSSRSSDIDMTSNKLATTKLSKKSQENTPNESLKAKSTLSVETKEEKIISQDMNTSKILVNQFQSEETGDSSSSQNNKSTQEKTTSQNTEKPFDIMDHISMIKVNGVGVLFQCKLCNRNFLKKEVVTTHSCARNKGPIAELVKSVPPPEPPRIPTIKYINTKTDPIKKPSPVPTPPSIPEVKAKPKIGPASKIKRNNDSQDLVGMVVTPKVPSPSPPAKPSPSIPSIQLPNAPNLKSCYKLIPGPCNTFTLVENKTSTESQSVVQNKSIEKKSEIKTKDRKHFNKHKNVVEQPNLHKEEQLLQEQVQNIETGQQPYPVGLFKTVPHGSNDYHPSVSPGQSTFTTPAMKKQSYTIVQTGNPSKLLISTKPQPPAESEPARKRMRKSKPTEEPERKEPYSVTLEDAAPPKDSGFFTFINVDPLLQPSYVLPTDNIIQESQISTSTSVVKPQEPKDDDKYSCNMCGVRFSREKKLLAHIMSHYSKMDEEDQQRAEKNLKKRTKKT